MRAPHRMLLLCALLATMSVPEIGGAQEITGSIDLSIMDEDGRPIRGATVALEGPSLLGERSAFSDDDGRVRVPALPVGIYTLTISYDDRPEFRQEDVVVQLGRVNSLGTITLGERTARETVVVRGGRAPLIDPTSTTLGANLVREEFDALPVERNYRMISTLLPMADQSFLGDEEPNFAGGTGLDNRYFIDGMDVTDPYRGTTGTNLPYNFIKEIEVKTGGYQAEYRSALGGVINVVTYSGSNEFRGEAFGFFANNNFAGDQRQSPSGPANGDFTLFDVGLSLGGPVVRDRLWFFAAYNPTFESQDIEIPGTGFHENKAVKHVFAGKLTWKATERTTVVATVLGDPTSGDTVGETFLNYEFGSPLSYENAETLLGTATSGGFNASLNATYIPNNNSLFETSVSTIVRDITLEPGTELGATETFTVDFAASVASGGFPIRLDNRSIQTTIDGKWTLFAGPNTFKLGGTYRENAVDSKLVTDPIYIFGALSRQVLWDWDGYVRNRIASGFAQNELRVNERFLIGAGLRWDGQFLIDSNGNLAQKITDQFQPRLGFTFQPGQPESQKIFGSYGRFYHDLSMWLGNNWYIDGARFDRVDCVADTCTFFPGPASVHPEVDRLKGQHFDELALGYERRIGQHNKVGVRGVYRTLRAAIEDGDVEDLGERIDNPGHGALSDWPKSEREYTALVLTAERSGGHRYNFLGAYTLSKNQGNYAGLFYSDLSIPFPNSSGAVSNLEATVNSNGRLPNDRTHVFKASGAYRWDFGLSVGTSFSWQTGTPLNEFEGNSEGFPDVNFARQRGTAGRTPSIWDLNLRFAYDLPWRPRVASRHRIILDIFHLGSERDPVNFEQIRYFNQDDGNQVDPNPAYGLPIRFQPPTAVRLGFESTF